MKKLPITQIVVSIFIIHTLLINSVFAQWEKSKGFNIVSINDIHTIDSTIYICGNFCDVAFKKLGDSVWNMSEQRVNVHKIFNTDSCIFACGWYSKYRSFDNGSSWEYIDDDFWKHAIATATLGNTILAWNDFSMFISKSDDNGYTFENIFELQEICREFYISDSLIFIDEGPFMRQIDINGNLINTLTTDSLDHLLKGFAYKDENYFAITHFTLYKYNTETNYWVPFETGLNNDTYYYNLYNFNDTLYCSTNQGVFYHNGQTWVSINEGLNDQSVYQMDNIGSTLFCSTNSDLYQKSPGQEWENITGELNYLNIKSIGFYQDEVWCASPSGIYKSIDNGENFNKTFNSDFKQGYDIILTDSIFYLSTEYGLFISNDYGTNWSQKCTEITSRGKLSMGDDYLFYLELKTGLYRIKYGNYDSEHLNLGENDNKYYKFEVMGSNIIVNIYDKFYVSHDYGNTFPDTINKDISALEKNANWFYSAIRYDNGIQRSVDGSNWDYYEFDDYNRDINSIGFSNDKVLIAGETYTTTNTILVEMSDYELDNWENIAGNLPLPCSIRFNLIDSHDGRVFVSPDNNGLYFRDGLIVSNSDTKNSSREEYTTFPNPVTGLLNIESNSNNETIQSIEIYTLIGEKILTQNINSKKTCLDISSLYKGIYLIRIISDDKEKTKKIIKL